MAVVRARNVGSVAYVYRTYYAACELTYHTESGRRFLVPEGTHCDIANTASVEPGQTVDLFTWDLDECVKDSWGCSQENHRDLAPGRYEVRGTFCAARQSAGGYPVGDCEAQQSLSGVSFEII